MSGVILSATLLAGGDYLTTAGGIAVSATGGTGSAATFDLNWKVISVDFTPPPAGITGGSGYQTLPTLTIGAPTGSCGTKRTAAATATQAGSVTGITVY